MDVGYITRNVANCERKIEQLTARIKNAAATDEDVDWLKAELSGYKAKLKELTKSDSA